MQFVMYDDNCIVISLHTCNTPLLSIYDIDDKNIIKEQSSKVYVSVLN